MLLRSSAYSITPIECPLRSANQQKNMCAVKQCALTTRLCSAMTAHAVLQFSKISTAYNDVLKHYGALKLASLIGRSVYSLIC